MTVVVISGIGNTTVVAKLRTSVTDALRIVSRARIRKKCTTYPPDGTGAMALADMACATAK